MHSAPRHIRAVVYAPSVDTVANSSHNSANDKLRFRAMPWDGRHLDDHTNDHDDTTKSDRTSTTNLVAVNQLKDGAEETADFVDTGNLQICG